MTASTMSVSTTLQELVEYTEAMERKLEEQAEQLAMQEEIVNLAEQLTVAVACYRAKYDADTRAAIKEIETRRGERDAELDADIRAFCDKPAPQAVREEPEGQPVSKPGRRRYTEEDAAEWYRMRQSGMNLYQISQVVDASYGTISRWLEKYAPPEAAEATEPTPEPESESGAQQEIAPEAATQQTVDQAASPRLLCRYCGKPVGEEGRGGVCARCIQERTHQTSDGGWACAVA